MFLHDGLINVGNNVLKSLFSTPFVNRYFAFKYLKNKITYLIKWGHLNLVLSVQKAK